MQINTKVHAKTVVSALRRELKAAGKQSESFSHTECLTLMAKALGFATWNAWEATLTDTESAAPILKAKYPLVNDGSFDFIKIGEKGLPYTSFFTKLDGTKESVPGVATVLSAARPVGGSTDWDIDHDGTDVDWDGQKTLVDKQGNIRWVDEDGDEHSGAQVIFLPDEFDGEIDELNDDLPVRTPLLRAFLEYFKEKALSQFPSERALDKVCDTIGYALTPREIEALQAMFGNNV
jgi:hypothetical protein